MNARHAEAVTVRPDPVSRIVLQHADAVKEKHCKPVPKPNIAAFRIGVSKALAGGFSLLTGLNHHRPVQKAAEQGLQPQIKKPRARRRDDGPS